MRQFRICQAQFSSFHHMWQASLYLGAQQSGAIFSISLLQLRPRLPSVLALLSVHSSIPRDPRDAGRSLVGRHGNRSATGRARLGRRIDPREDFFEGITISLKKFSIFWALLIFQVIKGCPSPSKLTKDISQSEHHEQRHNRNDGIRIVSR
jgi:hypothetical protein